VEFESLFTSAIEVGIGITGFSGIVAVLGHRSAGEWSRTDRGRMSILLQTSFATVLLSFLPLLVHGMIADSGSLWAICSGIYFAYTLPALIVRIPGVRELRRSPQGGINDAYFYFAISGYAVSLALQLANVVWLRTGWPYAVGILWTMTFSFTQFVRLMGVLWRSREN
jgi:predicted MFS family arabinose efflux permease